jgi:hypothetical protein
VWQAPTCRLTLDSPPLTLYSPCTHPRSGWVLVKSGGGGGGGEWEVSSAQNVVLSSVKRYAANEMWTQELR